MKHIGCYSTMIVSMLVLLTSCAALAEPESLAALKDKSKPLIDRSEVLELRLFLYDGKVVWIEPVKPPQHPKAKGEYTIELIDDLRGENIREVRSVAFKHDSPACAYWYIYQTLDGIVKICLKR